MKRQQIGQLEMIVQYLEFSREQLSEMEINENTKVSNQTDGGLDTERTDKLRDAESILERAGTDLDDVIAALKRLTSLQEKKA